MTPVCCPNCGAALTKGVAAEIRGGLMPRQKECLDVIIALTKAGVPPSYAQIADEMGLKSKSGINRLVSALEARGYVQKDPKRMRSLVVVGNVEAQNAVAA